MAEALGVRVEGRFRAQVLSDAFQSWSASIAEDKERARFQAERSRRLQTVIWKLRHNFAVSSFSCWRDAVKEGRLRRRVMSRVFGGVTRRMVSSCFLAWH